MVRLVSDDRRRRLLPAVLPEDGVAHGQKRGVVVAGVERHRIDVSGGVDVMVVYCSPVPHLVDRLVVEHVEVSKRTTLGVSLARESPTYGSSFNVASTFWGKSCHLVRPLWVAKNATVIPNRRMNLSLRTKETIETVQRLDCQFFRYCPAAPGKKQKQLNNMHSRQQHLQPKLSMISSNCTVPWYQSHQHSYGSFTRKKQRKLEFSV